MEIVGGLANTSVFRLRKTWDSISRASQSVFQDLKVFTSHDGNHLNLRNATRTAELPCLPYPGTFLQDLIFIDDGNADYKGEGMINWTKFQQTANVILQLRAKQKTLYNFEVDGDLRHYLIKVCCRRVCLYPCLCCVVSPICRSGKCTDGRTTLSNVFANQEVRDAACLSY